MKLMSLAAALLLCGCAAKTGSVGTVVLPTSNKQIDVVQHRSDSKECAVGGVLQTYDAGGLLIDSQMAQGTAFHCHVVGAAIQAGGIVGAASILRSGSRTRIDNSNTQAQEQNQQQELRNYNYS